jgi:signal transduction histidine kinase
VSRVAAAWTAALVIGIAVLGWPDDPARLPPGGRAIPIVGVLLGWGFVAVGSIAWRRRPDNRTGALMLVTGAGVLVTGLQFSNTALLYTAGILVDSLAFSLLAHLVLAYPSGRLEGRGARVAAALVYAGGVLQLPLTLFWRDTDCRTCPDDVLYLGHSAVVVDVTSALQALAFLVGIVVAIVVVIRRWRASSGSRRKGIEPVLGLVALILLLGLLSAAAHSGELKVAKPLQIAFFVAFALLPYAFLLGLVRGRFFRVAAVTRLLGTLTHEPAALRDALRGALGDPELKLAYWLPELSAFVDLEGREATGKMTEIRHRGRLVGALVHSVDEPELVAEAAQAAALAIENGRLEAELRARLEALRASRARIVEAGDAERRRLTRDLHDGAQQRLVSLMLELKLARARFETDPELAKQLLDSALENAGAAVEELRDLAAGIHPAVLSQRGLDAALEALATRAPLPVELDCELAERLPLLVETAAYFVVSEALTNVAKYANATHAVVSARRENGSARISIRDDGVGGASPGGGSGLRGLADRVGALDGTLHVVSPPGRGTTVTAEIPLTA